MQPLTIEITVRTLKHLHDILPLLNDIKPTTINLTDKTGLCDNLVIAEELKDIYPHGIIVPHYSFKNHTSKDAVTIHDNYMRFLAHTSAQNNHQILLISGSPRPKLDTLQGLELIQESLTHSTVSTESPLNTIDNLQCGVAYNPFLTGEQLEAEQARLRAKLHYPFVNRVYMQMGTLVKPLQAGVDYIRSLNPDIDIYSSVVIPTNGFLAKFKFRPWHGVVLDDKYLANLKNATAKTHELIALSHKINITPLLQIVGIQQLTIGEFGSLYPELYTSTTP